VKKFSSVLLMLLVIIAFSCAREEAEKATPLKKPQELTPAERLARAKEVFSAVEKGNDKQLEQLLAQDADVNYRRPSDGATALHLIAQNGRAPIGGYLISGGADVNAKDNSGSAPLHWAVENGHLAVAKSLIYKGADVNAQRGDGATPLVLAVSKENAKMVELLTRSGGKG
jgi:ankyrin repeat protein